MYKGNMYEYIEKLMIYIRSTIAPKASYVFRYKNSKYEFVFWPNSGVGEVRVVHDTEDFEEQINKIVNEELKEKGYV
jgi:hypothetical protein